MKQLNLRIPVTVLVFVVGSFSSAFSSLAQSPSDTSTVWIVETYDGNEYLGSLVDSSGTVVIIKTKTLGELRIPKTEIKKFEAILSGQLKDGQYWSENLQATRYFWAPNGYALKKGEGYYQNVWVFFNHMSFGLSESMSIGVGMVPAFLINGASTPVWITPKISLKGEADSKVRLGLGVLLGTVAGERDTGFGIAYGVVTIGSRDSNVNLGVGMGFANGEWANNPTFTFCAMIRTSKRSYLLTENYLINDGYERLGIISLGGRMVGKRMSFDLGLVAPISDGSLDIALPWLGISVPLGKG